MRKSKLKDDDEKDKNKEEVANKIESQVAIVDASKELRRMKENLVKTLKEKAELQKKHADALASSKPDDPSSKEALNAIVRDISDAEEKHTEALSMVTHKKKAKAAIESHNKNNAEKPKGGWHAVKSGMKEGALNLGHALMKANEARLQMTVAQFDQLSQLLSWEEAERDNIPQGEAGDIQREKAENSILVAKGILEKLEIAKAAQTALTEASRRNSAAMSRYGATMGILKGRALAETHRKWLVTDLEMAEADLEYAKAMLELEKTDLEQVILDA